jgi:hypothetical protein
MDYLQHKFLKMQKTKTPVRARSKQKSIVSKPAKLSFEQQEAMKLQALITRFEKNQKTYSLILEKLYSELRENDPDGFGTLSIEDLEQLPFSENAELTKKMFSEHDPLCLVLLEAWTAWKAAAYDYDEETSEITNLLEDLAPNLSSVLVSSLNNEAERFSY